MQIRIHVNFMRLLGKLKSQERKQVEEMMLRIQRDGITPGMREHLISAGKRSFTSLSPNMDIRVLAWKEGDFLTLLYVDHHDAAYSWAERNSVQIHVAELVSFSPDEPAISEETAKVQAEAVEDPSSTYNKELHRKLSAAGIPVALVKLLAKAESEAELLDMLELVSPEWAELIVDAVLGEQPSSSPATISNIWIAPDDKVLKAALSLPLSQWRLFLHPEQQRSVDAGTRQDLIIVGGPGTGKTVALVHRAVRLAKECKGNECVVLVGHSPHTVDIMATMVKQLNSDSLDALHIVDMIAIGRDGKPRYTDLTGPGPTGEGFLRHSGHSVVALLIDEAQDIHGKHTRGWLFGRRPQVKTHITLGIDFNQNVFSDNRDSPLRQVLKRASIIHFTYSYRIPREAGLVASRLIHTNEIEPEDSPEVRALRNLSSSLNYGFSSDFIQVFLYDDISIGILKAAEERDTLISNGVSDLGVIFCGNSKHRDKCSEQLKRLGYVPEQKPYGIYTPRSVKGLEFEFCIVIGPELAQESNSNKYFALLGLYVALSRCRRGLSIYTTEEFSDLLNHPAVEFKRC